MYAKQTLSQEIEHSVKKYMQLKDYSFKLELEYRCKDGGTKWGELLCAPYFENNEKLTGIHGVTRDITESKTIKEAWWIARPGTAHWSKTATTLFKA